MTDGGGTEGVITVSFTDWWEIFAKTEKCLFANLSTTEQSRSANAKHTKSEGTPKSEENTSDGGNETTGKGIINGRGEGGGGENRQNVRDQRSLQTTTSCNNSQVSSL